MRAKTEQSLHDIYLFSINTASDRVNMLARRASISMSALGGHFLHFILILLTLLIVHMLGSTSPAAQDPINASRAMKSYTGKVVHFAIPMTIVVTNRLGAPEKAFVREWSNKFNDMLGVQVLYVEAVSEEKLKGSEKSRQVLIVDRIPGIVYESGEKTDAIFSSAMEWGHKIKETIHKEDAVTGSVVYAQTAFHFADPISSRLFCENDILGLVSALKNADDPTFLGSYLALNHTSDTRRWSTCMLIAVSLAIGVAINRDDVMFPVLENLPYPHTGKDVVVSHTLNLMIANAKKLKR